MQELLPLTPNSRSTAPHNPMFFLALSTIHPGDQSTHHKEPSYLVRRPMALQTCSVMLEASIAEEDATATTLRTSDSQLAML